MNRLRTIFCVCCAVTAISCGIAAITIIVAIATGRLPGEPDAWMSAVFFIVVGGWAWIGGRAATNGLFDRISDE